MSRKNYQKQKAAHNKEVQEKKQHSYITSQMKQYMVNRECELLDFLLVTIKDQSKNNIKMLLTKKFIGVNGLGVSQYNYKLYKGDIVIVSKIPLEASKSRLPVYKTSVQKPDIIYEDKNYIAINKPSGLLSVESDKEKIDTAYKLVLKYMQDKDVSARCFQVHRIDKDTSGVLLFVKDYALKEKLQLHWNKYVKTREYIAITEGIPHPESGRIEAFLEKNDTTNLMYDTKNRNKGQLAITNYKVINKNKSNALVKLLIETGRKNQIRVAMSDLNCPIVGDDKYGMAKGFLDRLGLHASKLEFVNPLDQELITISAPIPAVFKKHFTQSK